MTGTEVIGFRFKMPSSEQATDGANEGADHEEGHPEHKELDALPTDGKTDMDSD